MAPNGMRDSGDKDQLKGVLCLEHCKCRIFAFELPPQCPGCNRKLSECEFRIPPFRLPSPLLRAQDFPCSLVIRPTKGDFLSDYRNGDNLHVAVTNSKGLVVEFDEKGVHGDRTFSWKNCVVVNLMNEDDIGDFVRDPDWGEYWDTCLEGTIDSGEWTRETYDEEKRNCLSFVLAFMRSLRQNPLSSNAANKILFLEKYVLPKTSLASKFICVYRKVQDSNGMFVKALSNESV